MRQRGTLHRAVISAPRRGRELSGSRARPDSSKRACSTDGDVSVNLGEPDFRARVPAVSRVRAASRATRLALRRRGRRVRRRFDGQPARRHSRGFGGTRARRYTGRASWRAHPRFPRGVNVGSCSTSIARHASGCACSSAASARRGPAAPGAAAAVAVGRHWGELADGGARSSCPAARSSVRWPGPGMPLWQTGPDNSSLRGSNRAMSQQKSGAPRLGDTFSDETSPTICAAIPISSNAIAPLLARTALPHRDGRLGHIARRAAGLDAAPAQRPARAPAQGSARGRQDERHARGEDSSARL